MFPLDDVIMRYWYYTNCNRSTTKPGSDIVEPLVEYFKKMKTDANFLSSWLLAIWCPSCEAIIWTNAGMLLIGRLGTSFGEILIEIHIVSFMKMHVKIPSGRWRPYCHGISVLQSGYFQNYPRLIKHYSLTCGNEVWDAFGECVQGVWYMCCSVCSRGCLGSIML